LPDDAESHSFASSPTVAGGSAGAKAGAKPGPHAGTALPGYEILSELGRGGMGVVYRARQIGLNRLVALKMILAGAHASRSQREPLRSEGEVVARLQHPHIVQIYDVGEHEGIPYFSLELVEGGTLERKLLGVPEAPRAAAQMLVVIADAIDAAH